MIKHARAGAAALAVVAPVLFAAVSAQAENHTVMIQGYAFQPQMTQVSAGDTVTFVNRDGAPHTATSVTFNTGMIAPGASATVMVEIPGAHDYMCEFHPGMRGVLVVE